MKSNFIEFILEIIIYISLYFLGSILFTDVSSIIFNIGLTLILFFITFFYNPDGDIAKMVPQRDHRIMSYFQVKTNDFETSWWYYVKVFAFVLVTWLYLEYRYPYEFNSVVQIIVTILIVGIVIYVFSVIKKLIRQNKTLTTIYMKAYAYQIRHIVYLVIAFYLMSSKPTSFDLGFRLIMHSILFIALFGTIIGFYIDIDNIKKKLRN